ncbi:MAG: peptidase M23 [Azospira oryzae]|uniref:Peptidoglycan DD-metalloendopeptidase family protein n=1 Tax=Pelomicrobium methylotrophicum TaxID=2602750 RepID=A0A5C7EMM2_9PROT|nr:peptidoglycan DD-metalloendopeptidase family protein [Pelomicrobium methylotrophicum]PZP54450.1 MAG: peptidase M23 [Azospira oryzae]PZP77268.1 MAG: peptidase M23 [Azospira oryzae]TXF13743.1 peptidoglycan DD-metalloendopeptidase family protein [Pelomicrobium methylotrophicum]
MAALAVLFALPAQAGPKDELSELRNRLKALYQELEQTEGSRSEAADALRASEQAISEANRRLKMLEAREREIDARLAALDAETGQIVEAIQAQRALIGRLLLQQYRSGRQEYLRLLLNGEDPNRIARHLHYLTYLARARAERVRQLRADLDRLAALRQEGEEEREHLARVQAEQAAERQRLEKEKQERKALLARLAHQIKEQRRQIDTLKRDEARLARLVERLGKVLSGRKPSAAIRNRATPDASLDGRPFAELKGRLRLPVPGELAHRFGSPREGGLSWKGLFIRADAGQPVKAIAAGTVVFADWLRGFGNLLILDHGQGFMSLYGFNEALLREVGDRVKGGDPVAQIGNTGGHPETGLYFEIRHEGKPLDPLEWVTLR